MSKTSGGKGILEVVHLFGGGVACRPPTPALKDPVSSVRTDERGTLYCGLPGGVSDVCIKEAVSGKDSMFWGTVRTKVGRGAAWSLLEKSRGCGGVSGRPGTDNPVSGFS